MNFNAQFIEYDVSFRKNEEKKKITKRVSLTNREYKIRIDCMHKTKR